MVRRSACVGGRYGWVGTEWLLLCVGGVSAWATSVPRCATRLLIPALAPKRPASDSEQPSTPPREPGRGLAWFRLGDHNPDQQDVEAEYDLYAAGSRRCLLSCNDSGQQRTFIFKLDGEELYKTCSSFLAMDGAAAGSGGARFSPYSHGRHDANKGKLGISIQWDFVAIATGGTDGASVPGRGILKTQPVTNFFADGDGLWDHRDTSAFAAAWRRVWSIACGAARRHAIACATSANVRCRTAVSPRSTVRAPAAVTRAGM
jgi:hypothetical protein